MPDEPLTDVRHALDYPAEPDSAFLNRLYGDLAIELGFRPAPVRLPRERRRSARWWLLAAALLTLALAGSTLIAGAAVRLLSDRQADMLDTIRTAGVVQVLVRDGFPQARGPQGGVNGFDTDVAVELARRLGVTTDVIPLEDGTSSDSLGPPLAAERLIAMASGVGPFVSERYLSSTPIYFWPVYAVVPTESTVVSIDELDGAGICVVEGTSGEAWLTGTRDAPSSASNHRPPAAAAVVRPADESCLDALASGTVAAAVTADLGPAELAVNGAIRALAGPVLTEEQGVIVDRDAGDVRPLLDAIDAAIEAARADGTLADLARSRFGGHDLSAPPPATPKEE